MNAQITSTANMMATIMWMGIPNSISKYTDISSNSPLFMRKLPVRKRWRKDRTDIAVFSYVVISWRGVSVRTPPTIVGRISSYFLYENDGGQSWLN